MRVKISEFRAKALIGKYLGYEYNGISVDLGSTTYLKELSYKLNVSERYVVKVDQAIKKRNKLGLVFVDLNKTEALEKLEYLKKKGYRWVLVEKYIEHKLNNEQYISIEVLENGLRLLYSESGGTEVENDRNEIQNYNIENYNIDSMNLPHKKYIVKLIDLMKAAHLTNLEINPFILIQNKFIILDAAVQADGAAQFLVDGLWSEQDFRVPKIYTHAAELEVDKLASKSSASLNLKVLNENGSIFMLLSGGGASVVISDELAQEGLQDKVANYGEYSGNPNEEDTYLYAKQIVNLLINSKSNKKVLIIAGGVANFTDVSTTFKGIIRAINDSKQKIIDQKILIVVRRGGPNEEKGLSMIRDYFTANNLDNIVFGSNHSLADITPFVKKGLSK